MNQKIIDWVEKVRKEIPFESGRVLDVGSLNVNGTAKHLFEDAKEYIGIDMREGKDVDIVMNSHNLSAQFEWSSFDTVLCLDMLEHDDAFWETLREMNYMLKSNGIFIVVMPTLDFPIHNHPFDYWRATEAAFKEVIFNGYDILNMETIYTKELNGKPINGVLCAIGRKKI